MDREIRRIARPLSLLPALILLYAGHFTLSQAQDRIPSYLYMLHATVTDAAARPLPGVEIRLDNDVVGITDATGQYYLARRPLLAGDHSVSARLLGFETLSRVVPRLFEISQSTTEPGTDIKLVLPKAPSGAAQYRDRGLGANAKPNYDVVPIFYVTDRKDTGSQNPSLRYSAERSPNASVAYGMCEVTIPSTHVPGELESPSWLHFEYNPDPDKHVVLRSVQPLERDPFYLKLATAVAASQTKDVVVFIHGYDNSFEHAARQTAQLARDANFQGAPILYSWPSKNELLAYAEDEDTVQWTAFHLRDFLEELARRSGAKKIHLIAHSMGNRALASALEMIASGHAVGSNPPLDQVVLAAPDISADTLSLFARDIRPVARRLTLYASENDDALLLSKFIHGSQRAGEKSGYLMVISGIDTVDASAVRTDFLGHSYFAQSGSIIDDIRKLLTSETPPELRNLVPATLQGLRYWIMPKISASAEAQRNS